MRVQSAQLYLSTGTQIVMALKRDHTKFLTHFKVSRMGLLLSYDHVLKQNNAATHIDVKISSGWVSAILVATFFIER